jgi:hypothetical protein
VDFPIKNGGSFHSYVSLPEGKPMVMMIFDFVPTIVPIRPALLLCPKSFKMIVGTLIIGDLAV